ARHDLAIDFHGDASFGVAGGCEQAGHAESLRDLAGFAIQIDSHARMVARIARGRNDGSDARGVASVFAGLQGWRRHMRTPPPTSMATTVVVVPRSAFFPLRRATALRLRTRLRLCALLWLRSRRRLRRCAA